MLLSVDERLWHLETWLADGDEIRRAGTQQSLELQAFDAQRSQAISYVIFRKVHGTYSDGKGASRPAYERVE